MNKAGPLLFFSLFLTLFMVIFSYTHTMMAGIYIVSDLGGSTFIATYAVAFFALGNALGVPLGRSMAGRIGTVHMLVICLHLFALFSLCCALSTTYFLFLLFRFMQGIVSGPFYTLLGHLWNELTPKEKKPLFTSITLTIFVVGPVLGASWGGWIAYDYNWRTIFYINIPILLALAWGLKAQLKNYTMRSEYRGFDGIGYFFYFVGTFCLSLILIMGQELDWFRSNLVIASTIIGSIFFLFFILWSLRHETPILDFRLLKQPALPFALIHLALLFSAYFGNVILLAFWLSLYVNYTPIWIGILIGTMAISGVLPTFLIMDKMGRKFDHRIPLVLAIIFLGISSFHTSMFNVDIDFERIALSRIMAGFGLALFLPPIFRLAFKSFSEEKSGDVVVLFQFVRALASGLGASLYIIMWQRRDVFYHERLGSLLTPFSEQTKAYFAHAKQFNLEGLRAKAELEVILQRESISLALDDCFYFMGWVMVALVVLNIFSLFSRRIDFSAEI